MRWLLREAAAVLIPVVVVVACFHQLARHPGSLLVDATRPSVDHAGPPGSRPVGNDLTFFWLPKYEQVIGRFHATGRVPAWDESGFGGRPFLGNPQTSQFYPPMWVAWWVSHPAALGWVTVAHLAWAGLGTYVLLRSLGAGRAAGAVSGACFAASPYLIAHTFEGHYPHVWSASWYPWAFGAYLSLRQGRVYGRLALPVVVALAFLTGHLQEWYYLVVALGTWGLGDAVLAWRAGRRREAMAGLAWGAMLLALSLAFCAVALIPEMQTQAWTLRRGTIPLRAISRYTVHTVNLFQLLSPFALGGPRDYFGQDNYWETVLSIGLVPLALAVLGAARHPHRAARRGFLTLTIVAVVFAVGRRLGLFSVAYRVLPGMERFRVPSRTLFLASFGAAVLVGLGVDVLVRVGLSAEDWRLMQRRLGRGLVALGVVLIAGGALRLAGLSPTGPPPERPEFEVEKPAVSAVESLRESRELRAWTTLAVDPVIWGTGCAMLALAFVRKGGKGLTPRRVGLVLSLLAVAELWITADRLLVVALPSQVMTPDGVATRLRDGVSCPAGPPRVAASPRALTDLDAIIAGVEKTNTNDSFQIQHAALLYERLYPFLEDLPRPPHPEQPMDEVVEHFQVSVARTVLDRLAVRWVATTRYTSLDRDLSVVSMRGAGPNTHLCENTTALPRCYVVPSVEVIERRDAPVHVVLGRIDPRRSVVLPHDPLPPGDRQPFTPGTWVSDDPDRVVIRVDTRAPGLLVVTNTWMPGWEARVDGRVEPVLRGDFWLQTVPIRTAGGHQVILRYEPPGRWAGVAVTWVAALVWVALAIGIGWMQRRKVRGSASRSPNLHGKELI
jgi:hypothetical protein